MNQTTKHATTVTSLQQAAQRWPRLLTLALALALALTFSNIPTAHAASISVDNITCTLVDAIDAANSDAAAGGCSAGSGADTIDLPGGTITLTNLDNTSSIYGPNGLPLITSVITINGNGSTIARSSSGSTPAFRLFQIATTGDLTLIDTTVIGGSVATGSGGILNQGMLTVTNSTISGNSASFGGGIVNVGTLTLTNSIISGNHATAGDGGGIYNYRPLTVTNSTISGNTASNDGGGIYNHNIGTLTVSNSTISGNSASNSGGGINNFGTMTISTSTLSDNTASSGGGIYHDNGTATLMSTLVAGNSATSSGNEVTNNGGSINAAAFNLFGHSGETNAQAFSGFTPSGSDISATSNGGTPTALASILDTTLQNNGGPTATHALVSGSPAIDAAPSGPATDQRGVVRPQGVTYDIGAFEAIPDRYADAVAAGTSPLILNPANAVGAPDGASATVVSLLSGGLVLDMGAGEEGTGNLKVYYNGLSVQVNSTVDFLNASGTVISSGSLAMLDLNPGPHSAVVIYSSAPTPYRFVKLRAVLLSVYNVDAVEAATIVP